MFQPKFFPLSIYKISGNSMLPTFKAGQKVFGLHWFRTLKKGDIIVVEIKNKPLIKRIIKINGQQFWLEGDNKNESTDSRSYGWINKSTVIAKIIY